MHSKTSPGAKKAADTAAFCAGIFFTALLIELLCVLKGNPLVFPGVLSIFKTFVRLLGQGKTWILVLTTLRHLSVSLGVSLALSVPLGVLEGKSAFMHRFFAPLMTFMRSVPMIVLTVIVMVLIRYSLVPYIVACLVLIPVISEAVCEGIKSIDTDLIDVYRLNSSFNLNILLNVYLPLISSYMKQAFTVAAGLGIRVIVTAEYLVQCRNSLGKAVFTSAYFNEYEEIYAWALVMIFMILFINFIPSLLVKTYGSRKNRELKV